MNKEFINNLSGKIQELIITDIKKNSGYIKGNLSSSALATAVAVCALYCINKNKNSKYIERGLVWLNKTMLEDGGWGDSSESQSNITATILTYAAIKKCADNIKFDLEKTETYIKNYFGGITPEKIYNGIIKIYGNDKTFSVPILAMCAICGILGKEDTAWKYVARLPYEAALLPQNFFKYLKLPVVSYAIPALISIGILKHKKNAEGNINFVSKKIIAKCLKNLFDIQPENGGFLEAIPLTSFTSMCLSEAGYRKHKIVEKCEEFIINGMREDGCFPIDTDLNNWLTCLGSQAIIDSENLSEELKKQIIDFIKNNQFKIKHKFTGSLPGGWGWTDKPGSVPDADDTAAALCALKKFEYKYDIVIENGVNWLINLQNNDGGIPTFCRGWSNLPFDRSCADISAHSLKALSLWQNNLSSNLKKKCEIAISKILEWLAKTQHKDGYWLPLWFGDQDTYDYSAPVYGTALVVEYIAEFIKSDYKKMLDRAVAYLICAQNQDGGWGGGKNSPSKFIYTAKAVLALCLYSENNDAIKNGTDFLIKKYQNNYLNKPEPIGLYFAKLWYSENMYNKIFFLNTLNFLKNRLEIVNR